MGLQATVIRNILFAATTYGEAYDNLRVQAGFTDKEISDSSETVEWQKAAKLFDLLADLTNNEQIGLALGFETGLSMLGMLGFMMQASKNLEEALTVYCRFGYMVCPMITFHYYKEGNKAIIELNQNPVWKNTYPRNARIGVDHTIASIVHHTRLLTGKSIFPEAVELEFGKIAVDAYKQALHCQVLFNAPIHKLVYDASVMTTPVITSDVSLFEMFQEILAQKKAIMMQTNCTEAVKNLLLMQFKGQIPTVEEAAAAMDMTPRTLQRKLTEENTSYRNIAGEVKKELAIHLMKNPGTSITEVAEVLGYGDLPAFRRAFKTWTKATPKEVKRQLHSEQMTVMG